MIEDFERGWTLIAESTNIGRERARLENLGITVTGFDHARRVFVDCTVPASADVEINIRLKL